MASSADGGQVTADETTVLYAKDGSVVRIVLNRPKQINAFNVQMRDDLFAALEAARDDPDVRAVLISGAGDRGFCVGADLTEFGSTPSQAVARQVRWERDLWGLFLTFTKPLVAALHGFVIGSGVEIACLCDIRIASESATFRMPETALGMVPAAGGSQTLPRVMGQGDAMDVLLANARVSASRAKSTGLVHQVVSDEDLPETAKAAASYLASRPPDAVAAIKQAVLTGMDLPMAQGLALERRLAARLAAGMSEG